MKLLAVLISLLVSIYAAAQAPPVAASDVEHSGDTTAESIVLHDGTLLVLRSKDPISSKLNHVGDVVRFEVAKPVMANDLVVIANGATVTARVTFAEPAQRKGKGGRLDVVFDTVELVTGGTTPIRAMSSGTGGGRREMVGNMVTSGLLTAGLAAPLFLLQRGNEVEIRSGEKFGAALARELTLPRAEVAAHQPTPSEPRTDIAAVYVIKGTLKGVVDRWPPQLSMGEWPFAIGERDYQLSSSSALRIELPPGQYWLHIWHAPLNKVEPEELISINAKGGESYYFQFAIHGGSFALQKVSAEVGTESISEVDTFVTLPVGELKPDQLERLRVQPSARNVADAALAQRAMQPSAPSASSEPDTADTIHLRAGQPVSFVLKTRLSSEHNKVGDMVDLEVVRAVKVDGLVVIAAGTQAQAEVVVQKPHRRKGVAGTLAIGFHDIRVVTGGVAQLAGKEQRKGANKRDEIDANMGGLIFQSFGLGAPVAPLFLLQRGESVQLEPGTQLTAFVANDVKLERPIVEKQQPVPSPELATIYLFHGWHPTCGSLGLPFDNTGIQRGLVRLEVAPGRYWFHTGVSISLMRGLYAGTVAGLTFGAAMPSLGSVTKVLKRPIPEFSVLDAQAGQTYYMLASYDARFKKQQFHVIDATEGEKLLVEPDGGPYYIVRNVPPEMMELLRAHPEDKSKKQ
jgi:hypothetical protein